MLPPCGINLSRGDLLTTINILEGRQGKIWPVKLNMPGHRLYVWISSWSGLARSWSRLALNMTTVRSDDGLNLWSAFGHSHMSTWCTKNRYVRDVIYYHYSVGGKTKERQLTIREQSQSESYITRPVAPLWHHGLWFPTATDRIPGSHVTIWCDQKWIIPLECLLLTQWAMSILLNVAIKWYRILAMG